MLRKKPFDLPTNRTHVAIVVSSVLPNVAHTNDSLEGIFFHWFQRVLNAIADNLSPEPLGYLPRLLAAWEGRPACSTSMAYPWCCATSGIPRRPGPSKTAQRNKDVLERHLFGVGKRQQEAQNQESDFRTLYDLAEEVCFAQVGLSCDPVRLEEAYHPPRDDGGFLPITTWTGLRPAGLPHGQSSFDLSRTSHHDQSSGGRPPKWRR